MTTPDKPVRWRPALRSLHRDVGYLAVGLTFVYAASLPRFRAQKFQTHAEMNAWKKALLRQLAREGPAHG